MEDLMQLVAAAFVRHGIECPAQDETPAPSATCPAGPPLSIALPDHNYKKQSELAAP
jgi:hypothetical protein